MANSMDDQEDLTEEIERRRKAKEAKEQKESISEIREHVKTGAQGPNMRHYMQVRSEVHAEYKAKGQPIPEHIQDNLKDAYQIALAKDNLID